MRAPARTARRRRRRPSRPTSGTRATRGTRGTSDRRRPLWYATLLTLRLDEDVWFYCSVGYKYSKSDASAISLDIRVFDIHPGMIALSYHKLILIV